MVRVEEIEQVRGRVRIRLDDGSEYLLLRSVYQERPLQVNEAVDPEEYSRWVTLRQYRSALEKAVSLLAVRARGQGEIEQKLKSAGYAPETVEMVVLKLTREGFLNDRDFAEQWVRHRSGQKYGPRRIALELRRKGVSSEETESALAGLEESRLLEDAAALAGKSLARSKAVEDPGKTRQRILTAVVRRGYSWDIARQAVDRVLSDDSFPD